MTFDPQGGEGAKREGMDRAERACNPAWWSFMLAATREVASKMQHFNTDDIERIRIDRQGPRTHENRAMGPLMAHARSLGICAATDIWVKSHQKGNHRRPMMIWYSLIYRGPRPAKPRRRRIMDPRQHDLWDG